MAGAYVIPNTFSGQSGQIPLASLDANFTAAQTVVNSLNTFSNYYADTGVVNAMNVVVPTGQAFSLTAGLWLQVTPAVTNTGASTLSINSGTAVSVVNANGTALYAGQLIAGQVVNVVYTGSVWQLLSGSVIVPLILQQTSSAAAITAIGSSGSAGAISITDGQTGARSWAIFSGYGNPGYFAIVDQTGGYTRLVISTAGQLQSYEPNYGVAALANVATRSSGSFTATFTGFASAQTSTVYWSRVDNTVLLEISPPGATSNSSSFTMTGIPSSLIPSREQTTGVIPATDNGSVIYTSIFLLGNDGNGYFYHNPNGGLNSWTASGVKGAYSFNFSYHLT